VEVDRARQSEAMTENVELHSGKDSGTASSDGSRLVRNSAAAVMLIGWLVDMTSTDQQRLVSEAVSQLCLTSSWNAMQCSKAGMMRSIVRCLQQSQSSSTLHVSVVGKSAASLSMCVLCSSEFD